MPDKDLERLLNLTIKEQELEALLARLGFRQRPGKGSHMKWIKKGLPPIILATHSKEIKPYQLRQVLRVLKIGGLL